ncbi:DUF1153 domain-containing protein [Palleronia sp. LCG004]|uniref:CtrA inhibitor SciP n=1 Tax=Palleronia sp. LCG004 TaxID=3079304 RepID=UPI002943B856|nr:DUF1153 domain-containing protein [Palleronia sp. LCG004]WOI57023.1 DUF1153 domain-containing protein [Palleronia sp. LCG004]
MPDIRKARFHSSLKSAAIKRPTTKEWGNTMYLKKITGPRAVTLPDGEILSRADLPDAGVKRWVASRKATIIKAIAAGLIREDEACETYGISPEELESWANAVDRHGVAALRTTQLQKYRQL